MYMAKAKSLRVGNTGREKYHIKDPLNVDDECQTIPDIERTRICLVRAGK